MKQSRRVSPRISYDEAVSLSRADGGGRVYGRGVDLSASGLSIVSSEAFPVGTEVRCSLLLPGGPRVVSGRVVRVTARDSAFGVAVAFERLSPSTKATIERMIESRAREVLPARLRVEGVDHPLRCEARVDDDKVRVTATLPFLRLDGGVDLVVGDGGQLAGPGVISHIALDPSTVDGIPRLALDVRLAGATTKDADGVPEPAAEELTPPPINLPPPCGRALPSVVVAAIDPKHPPRRARERPREGRVHHATATVARRADLPEWGCPRPAAAMPVARAIVTERVAVLSPPGGSAWPLRVLLLVPAIVAIAAALLRAAAI